MVPGPVVEVLARNPDSGVLSIGTGQVGTVTVVPGPVVEVLARNPDSGVLSIGTGQVGTVTVETVQRPVSANIFATGQVGTVTVEDTKNETITVG